MQHETTGGGFREHVREARRSPANRAGDETKYPAGQQAQVSPITSKQLVAPGTHKRHLVFRSDTLGDEPRRYGRLVRVWFVERTDLMHDLWHALTGYGADGFGEAALLPFSLAQRYSRSGLLLTLGAATRVSQGVGASWFPYLWRAYRRGRSAAYLTALPYEELLALPLAEVRAAAGIEAPEVAHPGGVLKEEPGPNVA